MLLLTLLYAIFPSWAAPPHAEFQEWLRQAAEAEDFHILRWDSRDLDRDGEADDALAWLCDARPGAGFDMWLVWEVDGERGVVERDTRGTAHATSQCRDDSHTNPPPFEEKHVEGIIYEPASETFEMEGWIERYRYDMWPSARYAHQRPSNTRLVLEVVDGILELTEEKLLGVGGGTKDYMHRVSRYGGTDHAREHALIVVSRDLAEQPTRHWILSGAASYEGPHDAGFTVTAVEPSEGFVDVAVRITDDVRTAEDRLELWFVENEKLVTLTISWPDLEDTLDVQWRGADPSVPMPQVSQLADGAVVVRLTLKRRYEAEAIRGSERTGRALTVVYHDVDTHSGRRTRIATSNREPTERDDLSRLVRLPDLHPFPSYRMREEMRIRASRKLAPGETRLRSAP